MSLRKSLLTMLAALVIGAAVAACGPASGTSPEPSASTGGNPTEMPSDSASPSPTY